MRAGWSGPMTRGWSGSMNRAARAVLTKERARMAKRSKLKSATSRGSRDKKPGAGGKRSAPRKKAARQSRGNAAGRAQELAFQAMDSFDPLESIRLATKALKVFP